MPPFFKMKGLFMKVQNKSKHPYQHSYYNEHMVLVSVEIQPGEIKEIEDKIAKVWIATGECVEFVAPEDLKAKEEKLNKEIEKLKAENAKLKEEKPKVVKPKAKAKSKK